eukprot:203950-Chlamydomonas_euryale.AAC.1
MAVGDESASPLCCSGLAGRTKGVGAGIVCVDTPWRRLCGHARGAGRPCTTHARYARPPAGKRIDLQESFFLSETMKYLFLTFSDARHMLDHYGALMLRQRARARACACVCVGGVICTAFGNVTAGNKRATPQGVWCESKCERKCEYKDQSLAPLFQACHQPTPPLHGLGPTHAASWQILSP